MRKCDILWLLSRFVSCVTLVIVWQKVWHQANETNWEEMWHFVTNVTLCILIVMSQNLQCDIGDKEIVIFVTLQNCDTHKTSAKSVTKSMLCHIQNCDISHKKVWQSLQIVIFEFKCHLCHTSKLWHTQKKWKKCDNINVVSHSNCDISHKKVWQSLQIVTFWFKCHLCHTFKLWH